MSKTEILHVLLYSLPEAMAVAGLSIILAGSRFVWQRILIMGIFIGFLSHFWRLLFSNYILNISSYILILLIFMTFYKIGVDLFIRAISIMLAISIYLTIEFINLKVFDVVFNLNPAKMLAQPVLRFVCFGGQILIIFLIMYLLKHFKFTLFNRSSHEEV